MGEKASLRLVNILFILIKICNKLERI